MSESRVWRRIVLFGFTLAGWLFVLLTAYVNIWYLVPYMCTGIVLGRLAIRTMASPVIYDAIVGLGWLINVTVVSLTCWWFDDFRDYSVLDALKPDTDDVGMKW